jgi:hypothetical protein
MTTTFMPTSSTLDLRCPVCGSRRLSLGKAWERDTPTRAVVVELLCLDGGGPSTDEVPFHTGAFLLHLVLNRTGDMVHASLDVDLLNDSAMGLRG